jgi:hypothetical protein
MADDLQFRKAAKRAAALVVKASATNKKVAKHATA